MFFFCVRTMRADSFFTFPWKTCDFICICKICFTFVADNQSVCCILCFSFFFPRVIEWLGEASVTLVLVQLCDCCLKTSFIQ